MSIRPFSVVGFDLDGTLLDTSHDLAAAVNHALAGIGCPPVSHARIRPFVGAGTKTMLKLGLEAVGGCSEAELDRLFREVIAYYEHNIAVHTAPFPGAVAAMDALEAMGVRLAICTNKFERLATKVLDALGLAHRFGAIIGGDSLGGIAKPDAAPIREMIARCGGGSAAFIGDSLSDMLAAHNAGIPSVAVSFGFLMQPVAELEADAVINDFVELVPTLEMLSPVRGRRAINGA
jgi:phosphoglycolate phosphatase